MVSQFIQGNTLLVISSARIITIPISARGVMLIVGSVMKGMERIRQQQSQGVLLITISVTQGASPAGKDHFVIIRQTLTASERLILMLTLINVIVKDA